MHIALFVRSDSAYKDREGWDAYDAARDALSYSDMIVMDKQKNNLMETDT